MDDGVGTFIRNRRSLFITLAYVVILLLSVCYLALHYGFVYAISFAVASTLAAHFTLKRAGESVTIDTESEPNPRVHYAVALFCGIIAVVFFLIGTVFFVLGFGAIMSNTMVAGVAWLFWPMALIFFSLGYVFSKSTKRMFTPLSTEYEFTSAQNTPDFKGSKAIWRGLGVLLLLLGLGLGLAGAAILFSKNSLKSGIDSAIGLWIFAAPLLMIGAVFIQLARRR